MSAGGIDDVFSVGSLLFIGEYEISANLDSCPGSALFIVAVLGALRPIKVRLNLDVDDTEVIIMSDERGGYSEFHGDTLTAACMAAIVAAYPAEEARKGRPSARPSRYHRNILGGEH